MVIITFLLIFEAVRSPRNGLKASRLNLAPAIDAFAERPILDALQGAAHLLERLPFDGALLESAGANFGRSDLVDLVLHFRFAGLPRLCLESLNLREQVSFLPK